ncbi:MAG TPA: TetR-like C-terminal domain-containing protein [Catenuloplanes sp.]
MASALASSDAASGGQSVGQAGLLGTAAAEGLQPVTEGSQPAAAEALPEAVDADLARVGDLLCPGVPRAALRRGFGAWVQLFGMVSFELFGQFENAIVNRSAFFDHQMRAQARHLGL